MKYLGIDLAWTSHHKTGICVINDEKQIEYLDAGVYDDAFLVSWIKNNQPCIVSIDAPLVVKNEIGGRACDSLLMKTKINGHYLKLYATSRSYMLRSFKEIRGEKILSFLSDFKLGSNIIETFPTGIYLSLFPKLYLNKYKLSSKLDLETLIKNSSNLVSAIKGMGFTVGDLKIEEVKTKKAYKTIEDQLDALLCAIHSYHFHHKRVHIYTCDDNGMISLPIQFD